MIDTLHIGFIIDFVRGLYAGTAFRRKVGEIRIRRTPPLLPPPKSMGGKEETTDEKEYKRIK